jgi:hypothetical protein
MLSRRAAISTAVGFAAAATSIVKAAAAILPAPQFKPLVRICGFPSSRLRDHCHLVDPNFEEFWEPISEEIASNAREENLAIVRRVAREECGLSEEMIAELWPKAKG